MVKWRQNYPGSFTLLGDGFFISYNDHTRANPIDDILVIFGQIKPENKGRPETALVIENGKGGGSHRYLILYGDHRKQYELLFPKGVDACIAYFEDNILEMSQTSDDLPNLVKH